MQRQVYVFIPVFPSVSLYLCIAIDEYQLFLLLSSDVVERENTQSYTRIRFINFPRKPLLISTPEPAPIVYGRTAFYTDSFFSEIKHLFHSSVW